MGAHLALAKFLHKSKQTPQPIQFENIHVSGDLAARARQNYERLQAPIYQPPSIFKGPAAAWPGDWEGRILLGLTLLSRSTGVKAPALPDILKEYPSHFNSKGYFGEPLESRAINEQQLAGHGWVLRGLCEYYEWTRSPQALAMAERIITNLALPTRGAYQRYPIDPALRTHGGRANGNINASENNWLLSSDIGCVFIFLDGVTHAWTILRTPQLRILIEEMIARFLEVDLLAMQAQAHATLTCLRAILRLYGETGDTSLLQAVEQRYRLYRSVAMTEHYANYNWFGRPASWTEPCAIIDSFIIAAQLWQFTGSPEYLQDAHLIWINGLGRGQRANGGYGTDSCSGVANPFLAIDLYEAFFCCTMRGGEGHARSLEYSYFTRPGEISVPFFNDSEATLTMRSGSVTLRQTSRYPYEGDVQFEVLQASHRSPLRLRCFAPEWTESHRITVNGQDVEHSFNAGFIEVLLTPKAGDVIRYNFGLLTRSVSCHNPNSIAGHFSFHAGPLVLVYEGDSEVHISRDETLTCEGMGLYRTAEQGILLSRINNLNVLKVSQKDRCKRQVIFSAA